MKGVRTFYKKEEIWRIYAYASGLLKELRNNDNVMAVVVDWC